MRNPCRQPGVLQGMSPRQRRLLVPALAAPALALAVAVAPAVAAPVHVAPNVAALPQGAAPQLPYVDAPNDRIVDGTRRVSLAGLQGVVTHLHKVDGGYVLGRRIGTSTTARDDLVLVTDAGKRSLLTQRWDWTRNDECRLYTGLVVSSQYGRIVYNIARADGSYAETLVRAVPSGRLIARRTFSHPPRALGYRGDVLLGVGGRVLWWTPGVSATKTVMDGISPYRADLSAKQIAYHGADSRVHVDPLPGGTDPAWSTDQEDAMFGFWSPDDSHFVGTGEILDCDSITQHFDARKADGTAVLGVSVEGPPTPVWETNSTLLIPTYQGSTVNGGPGFQIIRCTLTGTCQRVGPSAASKYAGYVLADRSPS